MLYLGVIGGAQASLHYGHALANNVWDLNQVLVRYPPDPHPNLPKSTRSEWGSYDMRENGTLTVSASVVKPTFPAHRSLNIVHDQTDVRLHVPVVRLTPSEEENWLSINKTIQFSYPTFSLYETTVAAQGRLNYQISAGIINPRSILIIPQLTAVENAMVPPLESPYFSAPNCACPSLFSDFNVSVDGINLYQNNLSSSVDFYRQIQGLYASNSNMTDNIKGGLTFRDFNSGLYKYYFVDISRSADPDSSRPRNIQIKFKNEGLKAYTLYIFVTSMNRIEIDGLTGARLTAV